MIKCILTSTFRLHQPSYIEGGDYDNQVSEHTNIIASSTNILAMLYLRRQFDPPKCTWIQKFSRSMMAKNTNPNKHDIWADNLDEMLGNKVIRTRSLVFPNKKTGGDKIILKKTNFLPKYQSGDFI